MSAKRRKYTKEFKTEAELEENGIKSLKSDLFYGRSIKSYDEAKSCIFEYISITFDSLMLPSK